jgi:tRNA(Arg) A34 adenosine deaminase TadA
MPCCHDVSGLSVPRHTRRAVITTLAAVAALPAAHLVVAAKTAPEDEKFMRLALDEARQGDFPFGAVIVSDGKILARGRNLGKANGDPTAHGEMVAIRNCVGTHGGGVLKGSTIYTTGEPCVMCMGAILWSHFGRLVFAASVPQLATVLDQIMIPSADIAAKAAFAPITITGGVLADEAMQLFAKK